MLPRSPPCSSWPSLSLPSCNGAWRNPGSTVSPLSKYGPPRGGTNEEHRMDGQFQAIPTHGRWAGLARAERVGHHLRGALPVDGHDISQEHERGLYISPYYHSPRLSLGELCPSLASAPLRYLLPEQCDRLFGEHGRGHRDLLHA